MLMTDKAEEFLTAKQVAERLKLSYYTVTRMLINGQIAAHRFGGSWRVTEKDLQEYIRVSRHPRKD